MPDERFYNLVARMRPLMDELEATNAIRIERDGVMGVPQQGVYVFYEHSRPLYVGRSNNMRNRIRIQGAESSRNNSASFAFSLLLDAIGGRPKVLTRPQIERQYSAEFSRQRERVRNMDIRSVEITDQAEQSLFQLYAIITLGTAPGFNRLDTY